MRFSDLLLLLTFSSVGLAYKYLVYNPAWGRSHVTYIGKLAEALAENGHDVTMIFSQVEAETFTGTKHPAVKTITIPQSALGREFYGPGGDHETYLANAWRSKGFLDIIRIVPKLANVFLQQCNDTILYPGLLESLRKENFDVAFSEANDFCGIGIFRHLGIEKTAITMSFAVFEGSFDWTGLPSFPSYVPGPMMPATERMTFLQRVGNFLSLGVNKYFFPAVADFYAPIFKEALSDDMPSSKEMMAEASLFFINSEPLIEFPRPIVHSMIDIAGVTVATKHEPLNKTWSAILDRRPKTVLLSFGSVAKSWQMPEAYKQTIRRVFASFENVTFIWKYERPEHNVAEGLENVIASTWVPQRDLLYDARLSLFMTHAGQGSVTELTTAGVPCIVVPILGDQLRNAQIFKRTRTGIVLTKPDLGDERQLRAALQAILYDDAGYAERARRLGEMIRDKPFTARELFVRNMEFLAAHGPLRQLDHYGRQLNFIQYYLIDVFAFIALLVATALFMLYAISRFCVKLIFRLMFSKKQKTE